VSALNSLVAHLIDGLLYPFEDLSPLVGLAVVSLLSAIGTLTVVRLTSNSSRLSGIKRALHACWFEIRLFNDDARAMWRALGEMFRHYLAYLRELAVPLMLLSAPLGLLVAQLQFHYAYSGLEVGGQAVVSIRMRAPDSASSVDVNPNPALTVPPGLRIETPPVWTPSLREAAWRIEADRPGDYDVAVRVGGHEVIKRVRVSNRIVRRSPVRPDGDTIEQLIHPAEPPLPDDSGVESIAVTYSRRDVRLFGYGVHWAVIFGGFTMVFALALRRPFRVVL